MGTRTIRRTRVTLPSLNERGLHLSKVTSLEGARGRVSEFHYGDADLRALDLSDTHLMDGRISGVRVERARLEGVRVDSVEVAGCDLSSLYWSDSKITRAVFRDCKLMGSVLENVTLADVLFENCKLDYSTLTRIRAAGPVIFSQCSLRETTFTAAELSAVAFEECDLRLTEFDGGTYRAMDLRGNDLSRIRGLGSLKQVIIDRAQTLQLAEALAVELGITYGEDLDAA
ncbi:pentapeptide repeat-containing protein [Streptomyces sp. NPDC002454]|uniref:pentapeptide repeat-containing protein n=1 Tax=Streptomyces sp. NPDC002490 TaxID=3154416 RepID=UPI00333167AF